MRKKVGGCRSNYELHAQVNVRESQVFMQVCVLHNLGRIERVSSSKKLQEASL
jgi:hypothetical protein